MIPSILRFPSHTPPTPPPYQTSPFQPQRKEAFQAHPGGPLREAAPTPNVWTERCTQSPHTQSKAQPEPPHPPAEALLLKNISNRCHSFLREREGLQESCSTAGLLEAERPAPGVSEGRPRTAESHTANQRPRE